MHQEHRGAPHLRSTQEISTSDTYRGTRGGILICSSVHQSPVGAPWVGSYSVVQVPDIVQETGIKTIPKRKKCEKAKWLSEEALEIAVIRREVKSKGEEERYII